MRLDHLLFKKKEIISNVYFAKSISYLFIFLSLFRQSTVELFEITKEGTESILIKEILF